MSKGGEGTQEKIREGGKRIIADEKGGGETQNWERVPEILAEET